VAKSGRDDENENEAPHEDGDWIYPVPIDLYSPKNPCDGVELPITHHRSIPPELLNSCNS
jgi:hypothetical protein